MTENRFRRLSSKKSNDRVIPFCTNYISIALSHIAAIDLQNVHPGYIFWMNKFAVLVKATRKIYLRAEEVNFFDFHYFQCMSQKNDSPKRFNWTYPAFQMIHFFRPSRENIATTSILANVNLKNIYIKCINIKWLSEMIQMKFTRKLLLEFNHF